MPEVTAMPEEAKKEFGKFDKYEVENAVDTLMRAEEIKANAELMKHVQPMILKKAANVAKAAKSIGSIEELKEVRQQKAQDEE